MRRLCCSLSILLGVVLQLSSAIVGRDLLLTPKQGLQLSGKRLYYEEEQPSTPPQESDKERERGSARERPWERTLKHVTYVTLFTDAAVNAAAGNLSQLQDYHDFLQSPYIAAASQSASSSTSTAQSRFGDIVTLASGRLERLAEGNGSRYRFVEGGCSYGSCEGTPTWALWQVQKIRHREGELEERGVRRPRRYHYEMKFSVTPIQQKQRAEQPQKRKVSWPHWQEAAKLQQSYIQKEADYPQSFGRIVYNGEREEAFAERRLDRNFRQTAAASTIAGGDPQATFAHGLFQPPPPPPPPHKLNMGEYLRPGAPTKATPKLELFPNFFNLGLRQNFIQPTTFRPNYQMKFNPRPELELYAPQHELPSPPSPPPPPSLPLDRERYPEEQTGGGVTHHFHHHFYMAPTPEQQLISNYRQPELSTARPSYQHHLRQQPVQFPRDEVSEEQDEDLVVQVTPLPLRRPQIYGQASKYQNKLKLPPPLLIYAAEEAGKEGFAHSEQLEQINYRYSEPDPLYVHENPIDVLQLEAPNGEEQSIDPVQHTKQQTKLEEQQQAEKDLESEVEVEAAAEQRPAGSQKQQKVATPAPEISTSSISSSTSSSTEAPTTESSKSSTSTTSTTSTTMRTTTRATTSPSFVSTSTSTSPLRALSRYKSRITAGKSTTTTSSTTTTTAPLSKWKRRKENATSSSLDSKAKSSHRHESKIAFKVVSTKLALLPTAPPPPPPPRETYEVLTQKSVSKSVSIKVGEHGEEIPIIVDDDENEVKRS